MPTPTLPAALTAEQTAKLDGLVAELVASGQREGIVGFWCENASQIFLGAVTDGQLVGWLLMPAQNEAAAANLVQAMGQTLIAAAIEQAVIAKKEAHAILERARGLH